MKLRKLIPSLLCTLSLVLGSVVPSAVVMADSLRVVTLGADLSDEQKQTMLKYFKVNPDEVQIIYVTNQDERAHLGSYVPLEQIGTRTVSCAYVRPTKEGGIKVRTANLNWVTGNMIASSLSTSGVKNCEVIAACPFEVSGTGALTGVQMAYEVASGEKLDPVKKDIATEEMVITGTIAEEVGQEEATYVINKAKMEVIGNNIQNADEITNVVNNIINQNNYYLPQEEIEQIIHLLEQMAEQEYDYDDMQETLEMVDGNVSAINIEDDLGDGYDEDLVNIKSAESEEAEAIDEDSIMSGLDEGVLGDEVIISSTDADMQDTGAEAEADDEWDWDTFVEGEDEGDDLSIGEEAIRTDAVTETKGDGQDTDALDDSQDEWDWEEIDNDDEMTETQSATDGGSLSDQDDQKQDAEDTDLDDIPVDGDEADDDMSDLEEDLIDVDQLDTSYLDTDARHNFDQAKLFCEGEYEGDDYSLQQALSDPSASTEVILDAGTGHSLTNKVMNEYLSILGNGALAYTPSSSDAYISTELNMISRKLGQIFSQPGSTPDEEAQAILSQVSPADQLTLYEETLAFFEELYGESSSDTISIDADEADVDDASMDYTLTEQDSYDTDEAEIAEEEDYGYDEMEEYDYVETY